MFRSYIKWRPYSGGQFLIAEHPALESLRPLILRLEDAAVEIRLADERHICRSREFTILILALGGYLIWNEVSTIQPRFHLWRISDSECLTRGGESKLCIGICVFCNFVFCKNGDSLRQCKWGCRHCVGGIVAEGDAGDAVGDVGLLQLVTNCHQLAKFQMIESRLHSALSFQNRS